MTLPSPRHGVLRQGYNTYLLTGLPRETVWKIETGPILKSHERTGRDQQALFSHLVLPETTFNEPSSYSPDSLSRKLADQARLLTPRYRNGMRVYERRFPRMSLLGSSVNRGNPLPSMCARVLWMAS